MHDFRGARAKIDRARELIAELERAEKDFLESRPYVIEEEATAGDAVYRARVLHEPPLRLSVIIGEALHDLRSALDHVAWELAGRPPGRRTYFPVLDRAPDEPKRRKDLDEKLDGIPQWARARIERMQPYHLGARSARHPLHRLHELNLADKHRLLNLTGGAIHRKHLTIGGGGLTGTVRLHWDPTWGAPSFAGVLGGQAISFDEQPGVLTVYVPAPDREVHLEGTESSLVPLRDGQPVLRLQRNPAERVSVRPIFSFQLAFDPDGPGSGAAVVLLLQNLTDAVTRVVELLAVGSRAGDGAV